MFIAINTAYESDSSLEYNGVKIKKFEDILNLSKPGIPDFKELNRILMDATTY